MTWTDQKAYAWLWRDTDLIAKACERLTRNLTADEWRDSIGGTRAKTCERHP